MEFKDYYKILGIEPQSGPGEIKNAYRRMVNLHHPDKHPGNKRDASPFIEIQEAYDILGNPEKRSEYDRLYSEEKMIRAKGPGRPEQPFSTFYESVDEEDNIFTEIFRSLFKRIPERKRPGRRFGDSSNHIHYDDLL
jgi:DnaJ-class molecular chaperone